ncbi:hypothetical protein [Brevibacterium pigmentatum]|uniref:hypothetical protein n=1 Tax=Brevibacterium pigmentatum TaxID=1496080 RepID=UPI0014249D78|nr:hypothetical protein [Brevibacterium pigmentatum]
MTDHDNLRDRIKHLVDETDDGESAAQAIIDDLHLESYPFTRHDGHTTTHVHGWMEPRP